MAYLPGCGGVNGGAAALPQFNFQDGNKFPLISREFTNTILFRTFVPNVPR